jgi:hypothetical protein
MIVMLQITFMIYCTLAWWWQYFELGGQTWFEFEYVGKSTAMMAQWTVVGIPNSVSFWCSMKKL